MLNFVLKEEQNVAITDLLGRKDVLAVLPTGYGKSLMYQYFVVAKAKQNMCASALVICPLTGIIDDQIMEATNLSITVGRLTDVLKEETLKPRQLVFASAEEVTSPAFQGLLKDSSVLNNCIELLVVDESHTVETWTALMYDLVFILYTAYLLVYIFTFYILVFLLRRQVHRLRYCSSVLICLKLNIIPKYYLQR